jgi:hypothetical protein
MYCYTDILFSSLIIYSRIIKKLEKMRQRLIDTYSLLSYLIDINCNNYFRFFDIYESGSIKF